MTDSFELKGNKIAFVAYTEEHVPKYFEWLQNEELRRLTCTEDVDINEHYEIMKSYIDNDEKWMFIIKDITKGSGILAGDINIFLNEEKEAEINVMIAEPQCRRKGLAQEAVTLMMKYSLTRANIMKFVAKIDDENLQSISLFKDKLQFKITDHSEFFKMTTLERIVNDELRDFLETL